MGAEEGREAQDPIVLGASKHGEGTPGSVLGLLPVYCSGDHSQKDLENQAILGTDPGL